MMSDEDKTIIGIQKCGCITYANSRPDGLTRKEKAQLVEDFIETGGQLVTTTAGEAKAMPGFMAWECPHTPKGWERRQR